MYEAISATNTSVVYATVSGFAERKIKYWPSSDYVFVVEVFWSDKTTSFIKRNYDDFLLFHKSLTDYFLSRYEKGTIKTPVFVPKLEGKSVFKKSTIELAETRELELASFLKQLLEGNPLISTNMLVLDFFKPRPMDPLPSREPPDGESTTDDYCFDINDEEEEEEEDDVIFNR